MKNQNLFFTDGPKLSLKKFCSLTRQQKDDYHAAVVKKSFLSNAGFVCLILALVGATFILSSFTIRKTEQKIKVAMEERFSMVTSNPMSNSNLEQNIRI